MVVGTAVVEIYIPGANSLKDKRRVLKGLLQRVRSRFNVAVAEVENQDRWRYSTLGLACVSNGSGHVHQSLQAVVGYLENHGEIQVIDFSLQVL